MKLESLSPSMCRALFGSSILLGSLAVGITLVVGGEFLSRGKSDDAPGSIIGARINKEALLGLKPLVLHKSILKAHLGIGAIGINPIQSIN
jgi:hypothetical protein